MDIDLPDPTEKEARPCTCTRPTGVYNMGQFHMRGKHVLGRCQEYAELTLLVKNSESALRRADPFNIETERLKGRVVRARVRLEELKRGGSTRERERPDQEPYGRAG